MEILPHAYMYKTEITRLDKGPRALHTKNQEIQESQDSILDFDAGFDPAL